MTRVSNLLDRTIQHIGINLAPQIALRSAAKNPQPRHRLLEERSKLSVTNAADHAKIGQYTWTLLRLSEARVNGMFTFPPEPILQRSGSYLVMTEADASLEVSDNVVGPLGGRRRDERGIGWEGGVGRTEERERCGER